jgi:beta-lactamase class A
MSDINATNTYPLLSKRIFAESQNDMLLDFVPLRKQLEDKIGRINGTKSFYFEYLPSGTSIKIGADNTLIAASLIKVPLTMNLYKAAELGKVDLDKQITITDQQLNDAYGNLWQKGAGTKITLREAAKLALSESDNTASQVIFDNINGLLGPDQESLNNFDIEQNMQNGQAVIDATSYGSVLKGLYLSSYLKREHSQEVLAYLSQSTAQNRMTAQLPKDVTVAHKIGVYNRSWSESDCGIVYAKQRPYLLCVMLGVSEEESDKHIAELSKLVYDYVINQP